MFKFNWLETDSNTAAKRLLGCYFVRQFNDGYQVKLRIVETESYDQDDAASHSYSGMTNRTRVMFGPAGKLYVYFTYGLHYCMNIVVGNDGYGAAVLIRALEPVDNIEILNKYRQTDNDINLTNGPAKLTQALLINKSLNNHDLSLPPLILMKNDELNSENIITTKRIGISKSKDELRRYYIKNNAYISRK